MKVLAIETLMFLLLAVSLSSCASNNATPEPSAPALILEILAETYVDGGTTSRVTHRAVPTEDGFAVEVSVTGAQNLKALFFELEYEASLYHPVDCTGTGLLDLTDAPIELGDLNVPGTVAHGQVVQKYSQHAGFSGDGVLARIEFAPGAAPAQRKTSTLGTPHASGPILFVDYYDKFLRVYHNIRGDYDQNGEVNLADIMPLSLFFGETYEAPNIDPFGNYEEWTDTSVRFYVDGNLDGEINLTDISVIAQQFKNNVAGFRICASDDYENFYPFGGGVPDNSVVASTLSTYEPLGDSRTERVYCEYSLPEMEYSDHFWIHPASSPTLGPASMVALELGDYPPAIDKEFGLEYDAETDVLSWNANLRSDLDQNGEVNLADLTPLFIHWDKTGPFDPDDELWCVDGTRVGVIGSMGINLIQFSFQNRANVAVYSGDNPLDANPNPLLPDAIQPFHSHSVEGLDYAAQYGTRRRFATTLDFAPGTYVWIRLSNNDGTEGPRSEVIQIP